MTRLTQGTIEEVAERLWSETLRTDFDFDFVLDEYGTTKASAEDDADHILEGEKGEDPAHFRDSLYLSLIR